MANLEAGHSLLLRLSGPKSSLRRLEWLAATQCTLWGAVLLMPYLAYDSSVAFSVIRTWVPEDILGSFMLLVGTVRLLSLFVNGARKRTTTWSRLAGSIVGAGIFTAISLGFAASGVLSTWIAAWPVLAAVEYINIYDTTRDARQAHG